MSFNQTVKSAVTLSGASRIKNLDSTDEITAQDEDNDNIEPKHKLQYSFTLWFDCPVESGEVNAGWANNIKKVVSFDTAEDFWCVFNNLSKSSDLKERSNFHVFKSDIMPAWEDVQNVEGGKWVLELGKTVKELEKMNKCWKFSLLAVLGGKPFGADIDQICGVVVSMRKHNIRLALWTKSASNQTLQMRIGTVWKRVLELSRNTKLGYQPHKQTLKVGYTTQAAFQL